MSTHMQNARPTSARPQSRINPITGEEMPYSGRVPKATDIYQKYNQSTQPPPPRQHPTQQPAQGPQPHQHSKQKQAVVQDICLNRPPSRPQSRPQGVPELRLGSLLDKDEDRIPQMDPYEYKLDTPDSASTVSWGTARSTYDQCKVQELTLDLDTPQPSGRSSYRQPTPQHSHRAGQAAAHRPVGSARSSRGHPPGPQKQPTAWDRDPIANPDSVPQPSESHRQQYKQYGDEMKEAYRLQNLNAYLDETTIRDKVAQLKLEVPEYNLEDEVDTDDQRTWTQQPYSKMAQLKRTDVEDLEAENRKKKLVETVMIDQLSRFPVCDPEQEAPFMDKPPDYTVLKKGSYRRMHDTRVKTTGTATENLLSKRVHFGARILSRCGRDAVRELTGFFFAADNSLTIYEFRQFGKTGKALPVIKRGIYTHPCGRRKGEPYSILDILQGNNLTFSTKGQPLPETLMVHSQIVFKITDVDDGAKATILLSGVSQVERETVWRNAHLPPTKQEISDRLLLKHVQDSVREQIKKRGIKVWTGLGRYYRKLDEGDGKLNKYDLERGLIDFHIELPQEQVDDLWELLDSEGTSFLHYDVFMRGFLGHMGEPRKALVRKAFMKMDANKKGSISKEEMKKFYNAHRHPKVVSRECREEQVLAMFMASFELTQTQGFVTYAEFEEYYEGLSAGVQSDSDFSNILRNAWGI